MSSLSIRRYDRSCSDIWNAFVRDSKNGTFLFNRGFADYHADRFEDHSLIVSSGEKIVALLPANADGDTIISHGGLTYGGFITDSRMGTALMLDVVSAATEYMQSAGFTRLVYKPIPHFYHSSPAEEDLYALYRAGARQIRMDAASAIRMRDRPGFSKSKRQGAKAARAAGIEVRESRDWRACWQLLESVLSSRHGVSPTHSLVEMEKLAATFPENIRLFGAFSGADMLSALVMFDCGPTVHVQYIATSPAGRDAGGVDIIVDHLLTDTFRDCIWFDFGISTLDQGRVLNEGLCRQKEMFGARSVIYQQLELKL
ncbi:GNAT family N-acetyltransferase [Pseudorhodobacter sp. E13]|uniref:GNAT family N-acetyltransferase n=1 Tax=Pseudorhodobacter sp. E13 TaxID=2487931 RepID=UPI000F8C79D4|nr:GNAT family N-acetyltransferase [Pseudorhodobacter sp. E13]RUS65233.1 GNAT family N-acetyltransferase [Pseudorhodobacter sp. E13]